MTASDLEALAGMDLGDLSPDAMRDLLDHLVRLHGTRRDRSELNKAAWRAGDRSPWGGEVKRRDPRRGWRNHGTARR